MTGKEFITKKLDTIANKITYKCNLEDVLFFYSTTDNNLIKIRSGYFENYDEAILFAKNLTEYYNNHIKDLYKFNIDISYICYIDGKEFSKHNDEIILENKYESIM